MDYNILTTDENEADLCWSKEGWTLDHDQAITFDNYPTANRHLNIIANRHHNGKMVHLVCATDWDCGIEGVSPNGGYQDETPECGCPVCKTTLLGREIEDHRTELLSSIVIPEGQTVTGRKIEEPTVTASSIFMAIGKKLEEGNPPKPSPVLTTPTKPVSKQRAARECTCSDTEDLADCPLCYCSERDTCLHCQSRRSPGELM